MEQEFVRKNSDILDLFSKSTPFVKVCAPMVRYSKLQFRSLVRRYDCDLCYTPMILADSFCRSQKARDNEFTTSLYDGPLITQFAGNTVHDFVGAALLASPYCDGVDLNCGCPQSWAKQQGLGCALLDKPENVCDIVRQCRNRIPRPFTISIKMRTVKDIRKSVDLIKQLEHCGVSFVAVHGRTPNQITGDVNKDAVKLIQESVSIPVIVNGGVKNLEDCRNLHEETKCKGVMVANGILTNPALFTGVDVTPRNCIKDWLDICYNSTLHNETYKNLHRNRSVSEPTICDKPLNLTFQCFHHHLVFMLEKILPRKKRQIFNGLQKFNDVLTFIRNEFDLFPELMSPEDFLTNSVQELTYEDRLYLYEELKPDLEIKDEVFYDYYTDNEGKYFKNKSSNVMDCDWSSIFLENG